MAQFQDDNAGRYTEGIEQALNERSRNLPGNMVRRVPFREMAKVKWLDEECNICGQQLNSWDARLSKTLAYKNPVCEKCIAREYDMDAEALRSRMEDFFGMRPCQGI